MVRIYLVDESIGFKYRLANRLFGFFRNSPIGKRQLRCGFNTLNNSISEFGRRTGVVQSDVLDVLNDSFQVFNRCLRPDYLESHFLRLSFTSLCGTILPDLISARPLSTPARKRIRYSISAQVTESGRSWIILMAISLLVILLVYHAHTGKSSLKLPLVPIQWAKALQVAAF